MRGYHNGVLFSSSFFFSSSSSSSSLYFFYIVSEWNGELRRLPASLYSYSNIHECCVNSWLRRQLIYKCFACQDDDGDDCDDDDDDDGEGGGGVTFPRSCSRAVAGRAASLLISSTIRARPLAKLTFSSGWLDPLPAQRIRQW